MRLQKLWDILPCHSGYLQRICAKPDQKVIQASDFACAAGFLTQGEGCQEIHVDYVEAARFIRYA